jgi:hypothetical protein
MPDTPVERTGREPYDPSVELRVSRLEYDVNDMRATLNRVEISVAEIKAMLAATLPHLATKAELRSDLTTELRTDLASKPSKTYMLGCSPR